MKNIITDFGKELAVDTFKKSINKYVLIGSSTKNDSYLIDILNNNDEIIKEYNINSSDSKLFRYIVTEPKSISDSMIDKDKRLIFNIGISPQNIPHRKYIYAICLIDDLGNVYSVNPFSEPFNYIKDSGQIITLKHAILAGEQFDPDLELLEQADAYITKNEFIKWAMEYTNTSDKVSLRTFNDAISKINENKVDKGLIGELNDVNSMDNSTLVNILNEIISSIGKIPDLNIEKQSSLVSAINELISIIGNKNDLNFVTKNLIDAINTIFGIVNEMPEPSFKDSIKVKDVSWKEKVDYTYVGNLDDYTGNKKDNIVAALNEIRSIYTNKSKDIEVGINNTGRYRFYTTNKNDFKQDIYHIKFIPELEEDYVYFTMKVTNTPLLNNSGLNAPNVEFEIVQYTEINDTLWDWGNPDLDPFGINVKSGTMGNDRIVELEFTKRGQLKVWGDIYQVEPYIEFIGEPINHDLYGDSYINLPIRAYGGDRATQDIGFLYTLTTPTTMQPKHIFNSGLIDVGYKNAIQLQKHVHSIAYSRFGDTFNCSINDRHIRYMGTNAGNTVGELQESGAPNVKGDIGVILYANPTGPFYTKSTPSGISSHSYPDLLVAMDLNRSNNVYKDGLNEIRVKSIISRGFYRLF